MDLLDTFFLCFFIGAYLTLNEPLISLGLIFQYFRNPTSNLAPFTYTFALISNLHS